MSTSLAPSLPYEALHGHKQVRILVLHPSGFNDDTISCNLTTVLLDDNPEYEALSYAWGDRNHFRSIRCNGTHVAVTSNLYHALKHLRYAGKERVLWADALCINQNDVGERNAQVQIMGEIFAAAQRTLVWLGEETIDVKDAFLDIDSALRLFTIPQIPLRSDSYTQIIESTPQFLETCLQSLSTGGESFLTYDWEPIATLLTRPWFQRKWIIQELVQAREAILVCGFRTLPWARLEALCVHLQVSSLIQLVREINAHPLPSRAVSHVCALALIREDRADFTLSNLLLLTRAFLCEDPRDHVFALFGLACDVSPDVSCMLRIDYTISQTDLYRKYVQWSIAERGSLDFLSLAVNSLAKTNPGLPSWIPDLSSFEETSSMHNLIQAYSATKESKIKARLSEDLTTLFYEGRVIDEIAELGNLFESRNESSTDRDSQSHEIDNEVDLAKRRQDWVLSCKAFASDGSPELSEARFEELWRTLIWDFEADNGERATSRLAEPFARYLDSVETLLDEHDSEWYKELVTFSCRVDMFIGMFSQGRRMGKVRGGSRLCSLPGGARVGDRVCCFLGGRLLYVVRSCGEGRVRFVGDCYVHGLMDGEAMDLGVEDVELALV